ncbi:hypothetical protein MAR_028416 [Mya arenaria]|uniref:Phytanoyl-CoA dioxygenase n=1 Tax=Mya arenaria TaxID=6604 RepID=A0ABY7DFH0_MYAAR|nr:uncharacterized protein LOC128223736 [Mya arenaria]WAQ95726.1 hypothetical protein MAR_028416 [Mya arenaria]
MITNKNIAELEEKGYTIVANVLTGAQCDQAITEYRTWLAHFGERFPKSFNSLIKDHNVGHMDTTWRLRLLSKPVFAQIWKTDKLLTSYDAIAIGRPPEDGDEDFQEPGKYWLHADTTPSRVGLHAYQGALYLEEQTKKDWTFQVIEGSHKYSEKLFQDCPDKTEASRRLGYYYKLVDGDTQYFEDKGCRTMRVPVPKGGMVLWDSRLVHANARPLPNRKTKGRWRFVTFISMTPAIWANETDLEKHREAYRKPTLTTHWSSQGIRLLKTSCSPGIPFPNTVPEVAQTLEARQLSAMEPYDFNDGRPNGDEYVPKWRKISVELAPELDFEKQYANGHI